MSRTLTDLSQLSKAMFKSAPKADEVKPVPPKAKPHDGDEEVLAYFSRPAAGAKAAQNAPTCASAADGTDARTEAFKRDVAALCAQLCDSEAARSDAEAKCADAEREREKLADALTAARKKVERLKGECRRLQGEARKSALAVPSAADAKSNCRPLRRQKGRHGAFLRLLRRLPKPSPVRCARWCCPRCPNPATRRVKAHVSAVRRFSMRCWRPTSRRANSNGGVRS